VTEYSSIIGRKIIHQILKQNPMEVRIVIPIFHRLSISGGTVTWFLPREI
jgi:hypothetical protein